MNFGFGSTKNETVMSGEKLFPDRCPYCDALSSPFLDQKAAASFLGISPRTLERFRLEGRGPVFHKFGRRCLYARADLLGWADAQRRTSTSDDGDSDEH